MNHAYLHVNVSNFIPQNDIELDLEPEPEDLENAIFVPDAHVVRFRTTLYFCSYNVRFLMEVYIFVDMVLQGGI